MIIDFIEYTMFWIEKVARPIIWIILGVWLGQLIHLIK